MDAEEVGGAGNDLKRVSSKMGSEKGGSVSILIILIITYQMMDTDLMDTPHEAYEILRAFLNYKAFEKKVRFLFL